MTAVDVHAEVDGPPDAPVVLLAGSLGSTLAMWDPQVPALAERFRVVRYDTRGHGRSETPPGPYSIEDVGRDVLDLLDDLGVEQVTQFDPAQQLGKQGGVQRQRRGTALGKG